MSENIGQSPRSDIVGGALWIAFGAVIVEEALRMDRFTEMGATLYTMPGFVPDIGGALIMLLGAALALRGWRRRRAASRCSTAACSRRSCCRSSTRPG